MKKFFTSYIKGQNRIWLLVVLMLVSSILSILEPYLSGQLVDMLRILDFTGMGYFALAIAVVAIIWAISRYYMQKNSISIQSDVSKKLELDLCNKALNIKSVFISTLKSGELSSICKEEPSKMMEEINDVVKMVFSVLTSVSALLYVAYLSPTIFILYMVFFTMIFAYQNISLSKEQECTDKEKFENDSAKSWINQIFKGFIDIKVLNLKGVVFERFNTILSNEIAMRKEKTEANAKNRMVSHIAFQVYSLLFLITEIYLLMQEDITTSIFITIYLYRNHMYNLIFNISEIRSKVAEIRNRLKRIGKILYIEDEMLENFGTINGTKDEIFVIDISNVSFSYGGEQGDVLKNISLRVSYGEVIGLVGASGSAKSTIIKLISRQLQPSSGEIMLNGVDIQDYSEEGYTDLISVASQQPFVFSCSIRENLNMVKKDATEAEMKRALEKAQILGVVESLKNGLDTRLSEVTELSGGEVQRLALARLFLKNTPIIILDEATSAIDNRSQAEITKIIMEEAKNHIFIIIAHRIEAVRDADRILFVKEGTIADEGKHQDLLERNEEYRNLVSTD